MEPSFTSTIQVSVMNKNVVKDDLVSTSFFDFAELKEIQVAQMLALGLKVPKVSGNAGVRSKDYSGKNRSKMQRLLGYVGSAVTDGILSR
jgi:hypothetical protein